MNANVVRLPNNWFPRFYQRNAWQYLSDAGERAVLCWPRRSGKDDISLHHAACASQERVGNLIHLLPFYSQARKAIWDSVNEFTGIRRIDEAFPPEIRAWTREQEMSIGFKNGSTWQLGGADSYNALVGTSYVGMVFSEYALSNPSAWGYFSPILMNNKGWAIFISTPRGKNHMYDMYQLAKNEPGWFAEKLTNDDTRVFTADQMRHELVRLQKLHGDDYGHALWQQEYFTSFDAAIPGSIWGDCVARAEADGRIVDFEPRKDAIVHTGWDLGRTDSTVVWFYQLVGTQINVIDHHESNMKDIPFYVNLLREKQREYGITYGTHWLPHDARARTQAAGGRSIQQQFIDARKLHPQIGNFRIVPRLDKQEGIQAARATFPHCRFHRTNCELGLEHLRHYHREWDEETQMFSDNPKHDFASHTSDAWRSVALTWKVARPDAVEVPEMERLLKGSVGVQTFASLKERHLRRRRQERNMRLT